MRIITEIHDKRWNDLKIDIEKIIDVINIKYNKDAEASIIFTNDIEIQKLNKQYRGFDKPTNVLSFETGDDLLLGDVFISIDTVMNEAQIQNKNIEDHITHLIIHGILHLLGMDHIKSGDAKKMESTEVKILKKLNIKNPYCDNEKINKFKTPFLYALAGIISALGFAPFYLFPLPFIGIGLAYYLSIKDNSNDSFFKSICKIMPFGFVFSVSMFWWIINSFYVIPELADQFAIWTVPAIVSIGFFGGVIFSIPFSIIRSIRQILPYRAILFAFSWVAILWFREWLLTGFPWNPFSNITISLPYVSNSMSLWGALGLTFILIGLIASVTEVILNKKNSSAKISTGVFISLVLIGSVFGYLNIKKTSELNVEKDIIVRIVQPSFSADEKASHLPEEARLNNEINIQKLISLVKSGSQDFDLIVFPETTYPFLITDNYLQLADFLDKPIITGATTYSNGELYNSMVVANEFGEIEKIYNKSHLVPFGEYRPFGDIIPTPGQLTKGAGAEIINMKINETTGNFDFAPAICYEIVFTDSLIPQKDINKPITIINITNDIWFGKTVGSYQHLDMVKRYAIESGMSVVRANYSGVSAFVSRNGKVLNSLPIGESGVLDGTIPPSYITPYRIIGRDLTMFLILLFASSLSYGLYRYSKKD